MVNLDMPVGCAAELGHGCGKQFLPMFGDEFPSGGVTEHVAQYSQHNELILRMRLTP